MRNSNQQVSNKELKSFGLMVGTVFGFIAIYPLFRGESLRTWAAIISVALIGPAIFFPPLLHLPFRLWAIIGKILGWINTRIILTVLYFVGIVPVSFILKISGKDPLQKKFDANAVSYREKPVEENDSSLKNQF